MDGFLTKHRGGCHCGEISFEFRAPAEVDVLDCNCSICQRGRFIHLIVPKSNFTLLSSEGALGDYQFGTKAAHHFFCRRCGVKSFYQPRSHPDAYSVNLRCVEEGTLNKINTSVFDGQNWEQAHAALTD